MTIKELRESKGLSQGKFAESIGIGRTAIIGYEKGKFKPSAAVAAKIKEVYGVDITNDASVAVGAPMEKPVKRGKKKANRIAEEKKQPALVVEKVELAETEETNIGVAIKALRTEKNLSQKVFGASIGVSLPTVGAYENGRIKPSEKVLANIKEVYGPTALDAAPTKPANVGQPATVKEQPVVEVPTPKKRTRKKAAPSLEEKKPLKRGGKKEVPVADEKKPSVVIQSPMGGSITPEEIIAKVGMVDAVYVRVDENKAYWVKGEEVGSVDLW